MVGLPPKYQDVFDWLTAALDGLDGGTGKIVLDVNGGAIDASITTNGTDLDERGRKVKIERRITTHLTIREVRRAAAMPLEARRVR